MFQFRLKLFTEMRALEIDSLERFAIESKWGIKTGNEGNSEFHYIKYLKIYSGHRQTTIKLSHLKEGD